MADVETPEENRTEEQPHPNSGSGMDLVFTMLAIVGLLTIVIGGSILIRNALVDEEPRDRIIRIVERDEPEQVCYEEVVTRGGGLFGDLEDSDDFDAEAEFADDGRRVIIICEDR